MAKHETPLLDQLESGPWPSFVSDLKQEAEKRAKNDHLEGGFQHGQPCLHRVDRNTKVTGDVGHVEELGAPGGQGPEEALELGQVPDLPECAHVPFQVGLDVTPMPEVRVPPGMGGKLRVPASEESFPKITIRKGVRLEQAT